MPEKFYTKRISVCLTERQFYYLEAEGRRLGNTGVSTLIRMLVERDRRDSMTKRIV
jgi:hypothetical protein